MDRHCVEGLEVLAAGVVGGSAGFEDEEFFAVVAFGVDVLDAEAHFFVLLDGMGWLDWDWVLLGGGGG